MSNDKKNDKLPTLAELTDDVQQAFKDDQLNYLLNQNPPKKWIREHPIIPDYKYIPIERIEYLLKRIFKRYRVEILREGQLFNATYTTVRVHVINPTNGEWESHDGVGAAPIQTDSGSDASDMGAIKSEAVAMSLPTAKSRAIKDAAKRFGKLFGADLNRDDDIPYKPDKLLAGGQEIDMDSDRLPEIQQKIREGKISKDKVFKLFSFTDEAREVIENVEVEGGDDNE